MWLLNILSCCRMCTKKNFFKNKKNAKNVKMHEMYDLRICSKPQ